MFTIKASSVALKMKDATPWAATVRRIALDVTDTSDACDCHADNEGEMDEVPVIGPPVAWELQSAARLPRLRRPGIASAELNGVSYGAQEVHHGPFYTIKTLCRKIRFLPGG